MDHSRRLLLEDISSSARVASHKHLPMIAGSALNWYLELASRSLRRLLTIVAAVWWRSKLTKGSFGFSGAVVM
jgi:hypothetical protein